MTTTVTDMNDVLAVIAAGHASPNAITRRLAMQVQALLIDLVRAVNAENRSPDALG